MQALYTPVELPKPSFTIDTHSHVMLLGSCFAEHIGQHLLHELNEGHACANPFGVLYNPISIAQALELLMDGEGVEKIERSIFLGQDGMWHSWLFSTHYSGKTEAECRLNVVKSYLMAKDFLRKSDLLCVTFGTTRYYTHEGTVVANCHKEPQRCFEEVEPTLDTLTELWHGVIKELKAFNPSLSICFTVSPYRYRKYGFHESQIQKSKLLLLTDSLGQTYFPAYEILLDELRDYRFYAIDMLHPSDLAVDIIYTRFKDWAFSSNLKLVASENLRLWKSKQHRQIGPH